MRMNRTSAITVPSGQRVQALAAPPRDRELVGQRHGDTPLRACRPVMGERDQQEASEQPPFGNDGYRRAFRWKGEATGLEVQRRTVDLAVAPKGGEAPFVRRRLEPCPGQIEL